MTWQNLDDVVDQLRRAGLVLDSVKKSNGGTVAGTVYVESSKSVRCDIDGEKKKGSGAYWLHELRLDDGNWLTGSYWLDHGNTSFKLELRKTCAKCNADIPLRQTTCTACGSKQTKAREIPREQIEAHKARMAEARRQAEAEAKADAERAAAWANAVWLKCREIFSPDEHDYLSRKNLKSAHGTRVFDSNDGILLTGDKDECADAYKYLANFHGALVVPMLDKDGRRRGLQFILSREKHKELITKRDGRDKEYWPRGMLKAGLHYTLGGSPRGVCLVAEGFATAASLHEATNLPVAVAFDANNLGPVGEIIWKSNRKRVKLLYTADDDWLQRCAECKQITPVADISCKHCGKPHGKQNAGVERAKEAALATSGAWVIPQFSAPRPDNKKGPTDYNDLRCAEGEQIVGGQIAGKLAALEWSTAPSLALSARAGVTPQGGGESGAERAPMKSLIDIDEASGRFALIYGMGGKSLFDFQECRVVHKDEMLNITPARAWDDIKRHPSWRVYRDTEVGFDPDGSQPEVVCNLYRGWPTTPKTGKCAAILKLLEYLCSQETKCARALYEWSLMWLAYPIQNPGAKMQTALIVHGDQGAGKNTFFSKAYRPIFGEYGVEFGQTAMEEKFNGWMSGILFGIGNEVIASREELYHVKGKIKNMITEPTWQIRSMHQDARMERNCCNFTFFSNDLNALHLDPHDRRFCVVWTPHTPQIGEAKHDDFKAMMREVYDELSNGGSAALHDYLLRLDLDGFGVSTPPPMTEAKESLIELNLDSKERFYREWTDVGIGDVPCVPITTTLLYEFYRDWCAVTGIRNAAPIHTLLPLLCSKPHVKKDQASVYIGGKTERRTIIYIAGVDVSPDARAKNVWLGDCETEFKTKVKAWKGE